MTLPGEVNPYLGFRGMRIYAEHRELIRTQLRAILRASAFGRIQIMAPMVSILEEVLWLKRLISELQQDLATRGIAFNPALPIGIMVEVPSVAFILDQLCAEVDFFSIGTNDLNQYFLAVDRDNAKVAELSNVRHPSFVRFLKYIVDAVHANGKWIGMCGEMAGDILNLPILIGLGLDEISASGSQIPLLKERISRLSASDCQVLLSRTLACGQLREVEEMLKQQRLQVLASLCHCARSRPSCAERTRYPAARDASPAGCIKSGGGERASSPRRITSRLLCRHMGESRPAKARLP